MRVGLGLISNGGHMEFIHCEDCGFTGENDDNGVSASDAMDRLECGEIDWDEYQELVDGSRFACPNCGSLSTEVMGS